MATNAELITQLYIGYYDRAPDPEGLNYWLGRMNAGVSIASIANSFATSPEAIATYPFFAFPNLSSASSFISQIYQNVFGRAPDADGLNYYSNKLSTGATSVGNILAEILGNASTNTGSNDQKFLANKVAVGLDWANKAAAKPGFTFDSAAKSSAATIVDTVTADAATVDAAKAAATNFFATATTGSTFTLTTGVDAGVAFTGTADNDEFNASLATTVAGVNPSTLNAADSIDGGAGTDTLNVTVSGGFSADVINGASIKNIEILNVRNVSGDNTVAVNAQNVPGATQIWSDRSTADLEVTKLATGATAGVRGNGVVQNGDLTVGYATATAAATLAFAGGTKAGTATTTGTAASEDAAAFSVGLNGGATAATISSTGAANSVNSINLDLDAGGATVKSLTINADSDFTVAGADFSLTTATAATTWISGLATDATIDVNGAGKVSLGTVEANVKEINAADNTGGVTVAGGFQATDKFVGGAGNDTLTAGAALTTGSADAGAGAGDRLVVTDDAVLATAALAGRFSNFEILRTAEAGTATYNLANVAGITAIEVAGSGGTTFDGLNAQTITVVGDNVGGLTLNKTGVLPAGNDALGITIDNSVLKNGDGVDVGTINVANIDTLNLVSTGGNLNPAPATDSNSATIGGNADLETVNLSGDTAFNLSTGGSTVDSVNAASFTADLTVDASGNTGAIEILGGSGKNTLTGSANGDVVKGGAAVDTIIGGQGADVMTGGGAADVFVINNFVAATSTGTLGSTTSTPNTDQELIAVTADTTDSGGERINISYTLNGVAGQIDGIIDVLAGSNVNVSDQTALTSFIATALNNVNGITAAPTGGAGQIAATADANGSLTINAITFNTNIEAAAAAVSNGTDVPQINTITVDADPVIGETYSFTITPAGGTAVTISATAATTNPQDLVNLLITDVNTKLGPSVTAADVVGGAGDATQFTITDDVADNGGFTVGSIVIGGGTTGGYAGDTNAVVTGAGPTLAVSGYDKITDFNTGGSDVLRFAAANDVAGSAVTNPIAGASVQIDGNGKVTFAAADDTLAEKVAALAADNVNVANNEVVFFEDAGNTYVYGAGVDTTNAAADFLVELTGVVGLTKITESTTTAGDFTIA